MSGGPDGQRASWRRVDGIVLLDKPPGASSTGALQRVRRLLRAAKAGHAGTLDPMATGMLPLCFGQATKASGSLLGATKAYRACVSLGTATDTGDAEGKAVEERPVPILGRAQVLAVFDSFHGAGSQVPPMHSALKHQGRPLYELARRGEAVPRAPRPIRIERLDLVRLDPGAIEFQVVCSKGTYVRVLGEDIARRLGTVGHLSALRRLWVEPFEDDPMVSLGEIERWAATDSPDPATAPWLLPVDAAFRNLPRLVLGPEDALHLRQGQVVEAPPGAVPSERVAAYDATGGFLGIVACGADGRLRSLRLFVPGEGGAIAGSA